jgi:hypothetical protein
VKSKGPPTRNQLEKRKMRISELAWSNNPEEAAQERKGRYAALKLLEAVKIDSTEKDVTRIVYRGTVTDETLTPFDVALICDKGPVGFGGVCNVEDNGSFICTIYTD